MNGIKATIIFCMTMALMCAGYLWQKNSRNDFVVISSATEKGVYIFNNKLGELQHCAVGGSCVKIPLIAPTPVVAPVKKAATPAVTHKAAAKAVAKVQPGAQPVEAPAPHAPAAKAQPAAKPAVKAVPVKKVAVPNANHPVIEAQPAPDAQGAAPTDEPQPVEADSAANGEGNSSEAPASAVSAPPVIQEGDFASAVEAPE